MSLSSSGSLALRFSRKAGCVVTEIPTFLCPLLARSFQASKLLHNQPQRSFQVQQRCIQSPAQEIPESSSIVSVQAVAELPSQCAGCGALSQTIIENEAGFYSLTRRSVKEYLGASYTVKRTKAIAEDEVVKKALENVDSTILETLGMEKPTSTTTTTTMSIEPPVCDRCHNLKNHQTGVSIYHPTVQALQQTISESPYKYNHIYHIIDAADIPMSFIPSLTKTLNVTPQRSYNRRSKTGRFYSDRKTEVDFVITRSDLLAPTKALVDGMMPYLTSVLRDALGRAGKGVRLGNVRCVSAERGWWTTKLKEDIFERGGGNWMVGKVNVGKSRLFHEVFPKGRGGNKVIVGEPLPIDTETEDNITNEVTSPMASFKPILIEKEEREEELPEKEFIEDKSDDTMSLLPPAQTETAYPSMPLVSSLPGTTASPIRVPFGNGKGELIDLPGISRGELELHVKPEHRNSLVMKTRVKPEQKVIKPGQSLILGGGLIRITPTDPDVIVMAYTFTSIKPDPHLTSTEKAIVMQSRGKEPFIDNITLPGTEEKIASAGIFPLKWDVTKSRIGLATNSLVSGGKVDQLPFQILSTDLLVEGCGWVELVAQVSKRRLERTTAKHDTDEDLTWGWGEKKEVTDNIAWPSVEVFTPEGKFVAARRPMNAWMFNAQKKTKTKARPRRSMKGVEKSRRARASVAKA